MLGNTYKKINTDAAGNVILNESNLTSEKRRRNFALFGLGIGFKPSKKIEFYGNISQNYRSVTFSDISIINPAYRINPNITDDVLSSVIDNSSRDTTRVATSDATSDATSNETGDTVSNAPSDTASNAPSDTASNAPSDTVSNASSDTASNVPSDTVSNAPSDTASNAPSAETIQSRSQTASEVFNQLPLETSLQQPALSIPQQQPALPIQQPTLSAQPPTQQPTQQPAQQPAQQRGQQQQATLPQAQQ